MFTAIFNHANPTVANAFKSPVIAQAADTADHVAQAALPAAIQSLQTASIIATTLFSALAPSTQPQANTSSRVSE